jgi:hypothetical protein
MSKRDRDPNTSEQETCRSKEKKMSQRERERDPNNCLIYIVLWHVLDYTLHIFIVEVINSRYATTQNTTKKSLHPQHVINE